MLAASALGAFITLCLVAGAAWWWMGGTTVLRPPRTPSHNAGAAAVALAPATPQRQSGAVVEDTPAHLVAKATKDSPNPDTPHRPTPKEAPQAKAKSEPNPAPSPEPDAQAAAPARVAHAASANETPAAQPSRKDTDVDLLQALIANLDKAPRHAGGATESILPAAGPAGGSPSTLERKLAACRSQTGAEATQCRAKACSGRWGSTPLCPTERAAAARREP